MENYWQSILQPRMQKRIVTILLMHMAFLSHAQKHFDLFYVGGNYNFMQPTSLNSNHNHESSILANLSVPVVLKDSSIWMTIVDYQSYAIPNEFLNNDSTPIKKFNLQGIVVRTGYIRKLNSSQSLQMLFINRLMTDFNASFSKSIQFGGMIMYEKIRSSDLTWRVGLLFNNEFFGPYLTPVLYLDWNIYRKIKFTGLLPVYGKLYLQFNENITAGFHFVGLTTSYRINELGYKNAYVERNSIDFSMFGNVKVWNNIFLEGRVGYSLTKDYGLYQEDQKIDLGLPLVYLGDKRTRSNAEFKSSPFIHLRLLYSLPIK